MPGWVNMRNVSHLPPAKIVSALTKAAPAFVSFVPLHSTVAAPPPPISSSCISASAWRLAGMPCATRAELSACSVTPLARSTTSGGRSSYVSLATNAANSLLNDMAASFDGRSSSAVGERYLLRQPPLIALTQRFTEPVGVVRPVPGGGTDLSEAALQTRPQRLCVGLFVLGGSGISDDRSDRPQLTTNARNRSDEANDVHCRTS